MKKVLFIVLIVLLLGVFVFSAWQIADTLLEYRQGEKTYKDLEQFISIPRITEKSVNSADSEETQATEPTSEEEKIPWPEVDFDALQQINEDVVGWIYIPDTRVNYPVVQGENNDRYLYRLLTGEYNGSGSIFLDAGVKGDFSGKNSPIYGHNMKNGSMFADMVGYKTQEFYDAHPIAMLLTPEKNYIVHLFSGYVTSSWGNAWDTSFTDEEFAAWLKETERKSYFATDVIPMHSDRILTFSTCSYETDDSRFVVHGVLEEYSKG